jgi:hypothetical protein
MFPTFLPELAAALRKLEGLGIIQRSREFSRIRLYRFSMPIEASRHISLVKLIGLTQGRAGRLLVLKYLKHSRAQPRQKSVGLHLA